MGRSLLLFRNAINALRLDAHFFIQPFLASAHEAQRSKAILDLTRARDLIDYGTFTDVCIGGIGD